ncbi:diguanylate cyclase [Planococcus versutus]|uniref:Diguanylate cyclase n=1 Tax=Planococcus versutus TaxID=1302659 RepID=A0A1B1S4N0_9BACL|nr:diguanylate cyclase [Planococcus versutus]ANU28157.1 diguanylate cyclase [Planococcus versutus]
MTQKNYSALLLERMEQDFSKWNKQKEVQEQEVYRFLHTMKGTAGTIGLKELADFCEIQLSFYTENKVNLIAIDSLQNFMEKARTFFADNKCNADQEMLVDNIKDPLPSESFVLVIDSDVETAAHLKETLIKNGIQVVIALTGKKGLEFFYTLQPHMVIVDLNLSDIDGFELVARIHETARSKCLPLAIVSSDNRIENQIRAMEIGATDFLSKPLNMSYVVPYVLNRLQNQKMFSQETLYDDLTGAGNRKYFSDVLTQMKNSSVNSKKNFTLVLFDLDYFKKVNDTYGHTIGDEVLRNFSQLVLKMKRDSDIFFRYGGEEFALILPNTKAQTAKPLIEEIRLAFANTAFTDHSFTSFYVSFSAGISDYQHQQEHLVSNADQALYKAKKNGRNQTMLYKTDAKDLRRHLTIIIIDDDSLVRKLVSKQFSTWHPDDFDIYIEEYTDGVTFTKSQWYKEDENYMILLDGVMPKMDGLEVLHHIRSQYPHENIIISMLTSRTNESDIVLALKSGADDYIVKPFYAQEVVARVQRLTMRMFN